MLAADPSATLCFPLIEQHQINVLAGAAGGQPVATGDPRRGGNAQLQSLRLLQVAARACRRRSRRAFRRKSAASFSRSSAWRKGW
jgi:non-ribosomal peptide synthetase component E (peptide arylation enzyme)